MRIRWFLTDACNLRCRQCNIANFKSKGENDIKDEDVYRIVDDLAANYAQGIQFLGGEPLLREDFPDILAYCKQRGLEVWLITNGFFVDEGMADRLVRNGLDLVMVSVDGTTSSSHDRTRGHKGSHARATAAVRNFDDARKRQGSNLRIFIDYILMRTTYPELVDSMAMAKELGADLIAYLNLLPNERQRANAFGRSLELTAEEYWQALDTIAANAPDGLDVSVPAPPRVIDYLAGKHGVRLGSVLQRSCNCGMDTFDLHHDGHLYPCGSGEKIFHNLFASPGPERWTAAKASINLNEHNFREAYFSETYDVFLRAAHDRESLREKLPEICEGCDYSPFGSSPRCMPLCRVVAENRASASRGLAPTLCRILDEHVAAAAKVSA